MGEPKIEAVVVADLFGDLVTLPSGRRGRPSHVWAKSNADRVILGLAMGYSDAEIAAGLRISVPTLRKHYFSELKRRSMQRTRLELWEAHKLAELANGGNVGAMKQLRKLIDKRDLELAARRAAERGSDQDEAEASTTSIGKKEAARRQAEEAVEGGSLWGADLTPGGYH